MDSEVEIDAEGSAFISLAFISSPTARVDRHSNDVYIAHEGSSINGAAVMWSSPCRNFVIDLRDIGVDGPGAGVHISEAGDIDTLLSPFCQQIRLPSPTLNVTHLVIAVLAQSLFFAYSPSTGRFDTAKLKFGIRGIQPMDRSRLQQRLATQHPNQIDIGVWGDTVIAHANKAIVESHGVVNWSILCQGDPEWACIVMLDIHSSACKEVFAKPDVPVMDALCGMCKVFFETLEYTKQVQHSSEQVKLVREIGRRLFKDRTKTKTHAEVVTEKVEESLRLAQQASSPRPAHYRAHDLGDMKEDNSHDSIAPVEGTVTPTKMPASTKKNRKKKSKNKGKRKRGAAQKEESNNKALADPAQDNASETTSDNELDDSTSTITVQASRVVEDPEPINSKTTATTPETATSTVSETPATQIAFAPVPSWASSFPSSWRIPLSLMGPPEPISTGQPVFRFDTESLYLMCRLPTCMKIATSSQPGTTICPICGVYSYVRYCSREHMNADVMRHFFAHDYFAPKPECGHMTIPIAIDDATIGTPIGPVRPYIRHQQSRTSYGTVTKVIERHRQAIYRSMTLDEDYFIFNDLDRIVIPQKKLWRMNANEQKFHVQYVRGTGKVLTTVTLPSSDKRKSQFDAAINSCLTFGMSAGTVVTRKCALIYDVAVEQLTKTDQWDARMCERLCVQMGFEFGYRVPEAKRLMYPEDDGDEEDEDQDDARTDEEIALEDRWKAISNGRLYP